MKRNSSKIIALLLTLIMSLSIVSCKDESKKMTVVIGGESTVEYAVYLNEFDTSGGLVSVLEYLEKTKKLDYEIKNDKLVRVGGLEYNTGDGTDICVYTSILEDVDDSEDAFTVDYKGVTYAAIDVDIGDMHLVPGAVIYIGLLRYL